MNNPAAATAAAALPCLALSAPVFHARLLDDILVASYSNSNATTRILLELLLSWHTNWSQDFKHQQDSTLQEPQQQQPQQQHPQQQQLQTHAHTGSAQQHGQQEQLSDSLAGQQRQQEQVVGGRPPDVEQGPDQAGGTAVAAGWTGAAVAGGGGAGLTGGRQQQAAPTLLQVSDAVSVAGIGQLLSSCCCDTICSRVWLMNEGAQVSSACKSLYSFER